MEGVPLWQTLLGVAGMLVWAVLCGVPALAIYSLAARTRSGVLSWVVLIVLHLHWLPLVTVLCLWAVASLIGWQLT